MAILDSEPPKYSELRPVWEAGWSHRRQAWRETRRRGGNRNFPRERKISLWERREWTDKALWRGGSGQKSHHVGPSPASNISAVFCHRPGDIDQAPDRSPDFSEARWCTKRSGITQHLAYCLRLQATSGPLWVSAAVVFHNYPVAQGPPSLFY